MLGRLGEAGCMSLSSGSGHRFSGSSLHYAIVAGFGSVRVLCSVFCQLGSNSRSLSARRLERTLGEKGFTSCLMRVAGALRPVRSMVGLSRPSGEFESVRVLLELFTFVGCPGRCGNGLGEFLSRGVNRVGDG